MSRKNPNNPHAMHYMRPFQYFIYDVDFGIILFRRKKKQVKRS